MTEFERHVNALVNGESPEYAFPKNESSWEELFLFGKRRIAEIVALRKELKAIAEAINAPDTVFLPRKQFDRIAKKADKYDALKDAARDVKLLLDRIIIHTPGPTVERARKARDLLAALLGDE